MLCSFSNLGLGNRFGQQGASCDRDREPPRRALEIEKISAPRPELPDANHGESLPLRDPSVQIWTIPPPWRWCPPVRRVVRIARRQKVGTTSVQGAFAQERRVTARPTRLVSQRRSKWIIRYRRIQASAPGHCCGTPQRTASPTQTGSVGTPRRLRKLRWRWAEVVNSDQGSALAIMRAAQGGFRLKEVLPAGHSWATNAWRSMA
jgi:hypothetical protein